MNLQDIKSCHLRILMASTFFCIQNLGSGMQSAVKKMPASKFLVQTDEFTMNELVRSSSLPCFIIDVVMSDRFTDTAGRVAIPVTDPEVNVTFYLVVRKDSKYQALLPKIRR